MTRPPAAKSRATRSALFIWFVVIAGLASAVALALYGLLHGGFGGDTHAEWLRLSDELKKNGEPLTLAEVKPAAVPDEQNFFAAEVFAGLDADAPKATLLQLATSPGRGLAVTALLSAATQGNGASLEAIAAAMQDAGLVRKQTDFLLAGDRVRAGMRALGLDFTPLAEAADRPAARFPADYTHPYPALPHLPYLEALGNWLAIRAIAELSTGDADAAAVDLLLIGRLADSLSGEPFLPSQHTRRQLLGLLAGCVRVGIGWDAWSDEQLARFADTLDKARLVSDLVWAVRGERAQLNTAINQAINGEKPAATDSLQGWLGPDLLKLNQRALRARQVAANQAMQEIIEGLTKPDGVKFPPAEAMPPTAVARVQALEKDAQLSAQLQTYLAQAQLACALERYHLANGHYPAQLADLVPTQIGAVPPDPMSGHPLDYAPKGTSGYSLTGIGWPGGQPWVWARN